MGVRICTPYPPPLLLSQWATLNHYLCHAQTPRELPGVDDVPACLHVDVVCLQIYDEQVTPRQVGGALPTG